MNVPKPLFALFCICLIGIVVCFGLSGDASTVAGYKAWKVGGIVCSAVTALGLIWLWSKSRGK